MDRLDLPAADVTADHLGRPRQLRLRILRLVGVVGATIALAVLGSAAPAAAHVTLEPSTTAAGASSILEFSVGHGCDGSPTTGLTIQIPPEINAASPTRDALWEAKKEVVELDPPVSDAHGNQLTERVASVTFSTDEPLQEGYRDTVSLSVQVPDSEGTTLVFPVIQRCESGESAWVEVPGAGLSEDELELPAPSFTITASDGDAHGETSPTTDPTPTPDADESTAAPASRQPEDSGPLSVAALAAGVLGVLLGGAALVLQRRSR